MVFFDVVVDSEVQLLLPLTPKLLLPPQRPPEDRLPMTELSLSVQAGITGGIDWDWAWNERCQGTRRFRTRHAGWSRPVKTWAMR